MTHLPLSLVLGGNFLHKYNLDMQFKVVEIEERTKVMLKARFPFWATLQFLFLKQLSQDLLAQQAQQPGYDHPLSPLLSPPLSVLLPDPSLPERKGWVALMSWVLANANLLLPDLLDYPIEFYQEVVMARTKGTLVPTIEVRLRPPPPLHLISLGVARLPHSSQVCLCLPHSAHLHTGRCGHPCSDRGASSGRG